MIAVVIVAAGLLVIALYRIKIDMDIVGALPQTDNVISDARYIMLHHPGQDQILIDVSHQAHDPDVLVEAGDLVETRLIESRLFESVGMKGSLALFPELVSHIIKNLPVMFTDKELENKIGPLLEPGQVHKRLEDLLLTLQGIGGIGQVEMVAKDPLGLTNLVLARLSHLAPPRDSRIYGGQLLSSDGRHLLMVAKPRGSGTDTAFSRRTMALIDGLTQELNRKYSEKGYSFTLSPVGAFRAALDNEFLAKSDTRRAILFSIIGIALLLIFAFPRPFLGLLSFVPAIAGVIVAFFVYSLFHKSISILTIGFGGGIISITVDHGLAYLLFLDRPYQTFGREASREVWAVGLLATLTTVGAFVVLTISGFPVLSQIGQFAALGIGFSFLFVHTIFPLIFPVMPPLRQKRSVPVQGLVNKLALKGGKHKAYGALVFALFMLCFARPDFLVDIRAMNTVSEETRTAEERFKDVWGDFLSKIYLSTEGQSVQELQRTGDRLSSILEERAASGALASLFIPSMIFPGEIREKQNLMAWREFWKNDRVLKLKKSIETASHDLGFSPDAFDGFFKTIQEGNPGNLDIPERFFPLLGIAKSRVGTGWMQFATLTPRDGYDAKRLYSDCQSVGQVRIFDPNLFSERLGQLLSATFLKMLFIIGASAVILLFLFYLDWQLTLVSLLPISFAFVSTLGTLKLMGHPLDIPALMLSVVVVGMGIDYSIFFVRSYQRYMDQTDPSLGLIRMAVFLSGTSTMIGFGVLAFAAHAMLRSAGVTSFLGIAYSLLGTFAILPPILKRLFDPVEPPETDMRQGKKMALATIVKPYRHLEAYVRLYVRFRIMFDPMFSELSLFLDSPKTVIDIGSGYGVAALWVLALHPQARVYGIEPDREKARIASRVIGKRGSIEPGGAPTIPAVAVPADLAIMIDLIEKLEDDQLRLTLERLHDQLSPGGRLIIRAANCPGNRTGWSKRVCNMRDNVFRRKPHYRSVDKIKSFISQTGFECVKTEPSGSGHPRTWFLAKARKG